MCEKNQTRISVEFPKGNIEAVIEQSDTTLHPFQDRATLHLWFKPKDGYSSVHIATVYHIESVQKIEPKSALSQVRLKIMARSSFSQEDGYPMNEVSLWGTSVSNGCMSASLPYSTALPVETLGKIQAAIQSYLHAPVPAEV